MALSPAAADTNEDQAHIGLVAVTHHPARVASIEAASLHAIWSSEKSLKKRKTCYQPC